MQAIRGEEESLKQMKERNEGIERDVQRFKERKRIEHMVCDISVLALNDCLTPAIRSLC
jgi:hypothetical protein